MQSRPSSGGLAGASEKSSIVYFLSDVLIINHDFLVKPYVRIIKKIMAVCYTVKVYLCS